MISRRQLLLGAAVALAMPRARAHIGPRGSVSPVIINNPMGANIAAGGDAAFVAEDMPLTQDIIPICGGFYGATAGSIGSTLSTVDSSGWPTEDFGFTLHHSGQSPSWLTYGGNAFAFGYVSKGSGTETLTAINGTIANVAYNSGTKLRTFDFTPTADFPGITITGTSSGVTGLYGYLPKYRANASQGHVDITTANVLAGKQIFTAEAIALFGQFARIKSEWAQNVWNNFGAEYVGFTSNPSAGATSAVLSTAVSPGTYSIGSSGGCIFGPSTYETTPDVRSVTVAGDGVTCTWTGELVYAAKGLAFPNNNTARRTTLNTKADYWHQGGLLDIEGYPLGMFTAFAAACGNDLYYHLPVSDDGTYYPAAMSQAQAERQSGRNQYTELGNELWNGSIAQQAFSGLASAAGLTTAQYLATRLHAIAQEGISLNGSAWNNGVYLIAAWQNGAANFFNSFCSYYKAQGWNLAGEIYALSLAPYFIGSPAIVSTDTVAEIEAKVTTGTTFPYVQNHSGQQMSIESCIAVALWYGLKGGLECYEANWDSVNEYSYVANANIGATIMDSGMTSIMTNAWKSLLDIGVQRINIFEIGDSSDTTAQSPRYEITNTYGAENSAPRLIAAQAVMNDQWTPSRNVVAATGTTQIDARNYLDSTPAINSSYPGYTSSSNISPVNAYNEGQMIQVPTACTKTIKAYFYSTASGNLNLYLDGVEIASSVNVPNGLNGTSSAPVTFATSQALTAGHHYLEFGTGSSVGGITRAAVEFD
jgi:hypothetical protein